ncbi:MAG: GHKL domain-containing protein [Cytophagia bacterium]|nr:MAG: GHKL domain-containing protein [Cytophagia bacterium]TAG45799.1 MAG: GHKL domain-containing protein [Cytophagia bacterium]TAH28577.1 MAG: GHKL domain-containing protein [Cytophagales bacterium]
MRFSSRLISFLLAFSVALITTAFISLIKEANFPILFIAFGISLSSAFILSYFTLEFLVLGEINEAYNMLAKMKKKDFKLHKKKVSNITPIQKLNEQLHHYAQNKQEEIDKLEELGTYRREFLADVSHELKTPIFAAQGFIHTLLDGAVDDIEVRHKFLQKAANSLDGLNGLVEDLFTLSQLETHIIVMKKQKVNIINLIDRAFEQVEEKAREKKIYCIFEPENEDIFVEVDTEKMLRVFINLITNAIKYGKENGKVEVIITQQNKKIKISIKDDGQGIPPEHIERIFERFYRVEKSRTKQKGGSGLGLAIVKHIIEAHQTHIFVKSKINEGTLFWFELDEI